MFIVFMEFTYRNFLILLVTIATIFTQHSIAENASPLRDPASGACLSCKRKTLLHIGDSQTEGYFGEYLYKFLSKKLGGSGLAIVGVGSSSPRHWAQPLNTEYPKWLCSRTGRVNGHSHVSMHDTACMGTSNQSAFSILNQGHEASFVIFQFLGNSEQFKKSFIEKQIKSLTASLGKNQKCLFIITQPSHESLKEKNKRRLQIRDYIVSAAQKRCKIFDGMSKKYIDSFSKRKDFYQNDLIHLSPLGAKTFVEYLEPALNELIDK